jgi:hypothetical protein
MIASCYLIVARKRGYQRQARVVRVTKNRPTLDYDEAVIRLNLELPDELWDAPLLTVPVAIDEVLVGVAVETPDPDVEDGDEQ